MLNFALNPAPTKHKVTQINHSHAGSRLCEVTASCSILINLNLLLHTYNEDNRAVYLLLCFKAKTTASLLRGEL